MIDSTTQRALDLIRERNLDINGALILSAEAGEVKLGVLEVSGQAIAQIEQRIAEQKARLESADQGDVRTLCEHIGRLEGDLLYGRYYQSRPAIYVVSAHGD